MSKSKIQLSVLLTFLTVIIPINTLYNTDDNALPSAVSSSPAIWAEGNPYVKSVDQNSVGCVKWFSDKDIGKNLTNTGVSSSHYFLFMPASADLENLTLWHTFSENPSINGTEIISGEPSSAIKGSGDYTVTAGDDTFLLTIAQSESIGSVYINTASGSMYNVHKNKNYKEAGEILVTQPDGTSDYNGNLEYIKGRGNSTWKNNDKKPYNIKLEKKSSLLGMDTSKKWCLIANALDNSMLRNKIAYDLADEVGIEFSPDSAFTDLYLNGEYAGIYQLTEKVEVGKNNLVKINDLEELTEKANDTDLDSFKNIRKSNIKYYDIPINPTDITGGYLLEWEFEKRYETEPSGFITDRGQYVVIKNPEHPTKAQAEYIKSYVQDMEDAIYSENGSNPKGRHYTDYLDIESAALMFLLQEYTLEGDTGMTSCFFYKDCDTNGDGKVHASCPWDFDYAFGNYIYEKDGVSMQQADSIYAEKTKLKNGEYTIFAMLFQHEDFRDTVCKMYNTKFKPALQILLGKTDNSGEHICSMEKYIEILESSANLDLFRWPIVENQINPFVGYNYIDQISYLYNFLNERAFYFNRYLKNIRSDSDTFPIYFKNSNNWDKVNVFYKNGKNQIEWPGIEIKTINITLDNSEIFKIDLKDYGENDNGDIKLIINDGTANQTEELRAGRNTIYTPELSPYLTINYYEPPKSYYRCSDNDFFEKYINEHTELIGDLNNDGEITAADALYILQLSLDMRSFKKYDNIKANIDGKRGVTAADSMMILRYSIGYKDTNSLADNTFTYNSYDDPYFTV